MKTTLKTRLTLLIALAVASMSAQASEDIYVGSIIAGSPNPGRTLFGTYRNLQNYDSLYLGMESQPVGYGNYLILDTAIAVDKRAYMRLRSIEITLRAARSTRGNIDLWLKNWRTGGYDLLGTMTFDSWFRTMRIIKKTPVDINAYVNFSGILSARFATYGLVPFSLYADEVGFVAITP